jgi:peptidoglycan/xylan/chitin deacetylase (PgdA/CDA1 family)
VIYYHDVVQGEGDSYMKINLARFKEQMLYLKSQGYETVTFNDLNKSTSKISYSPRRVLITFDDGWRSNFSEIFDWMCQMGIRYNIFLTMGKIGTDPLYLDWSEVKKMSDSGMVGFGIHTYTHPDLSQDGQFDAELEFTQANKLFVEHLGVNPTDFCYPYGKYSSQIQNYLIENKFYPRIYTSDLTYTYHVGEALVFGRNAISNDYPIKVFRNKVRGYYNIFKSLRG